jgi:tellurite resistance protein
MASRNGLLTKVVESTGAVQIYGEGNEAVKVTASMAARPCRVVVQFADGTVQREEWALLEAICRNLALGVVR